MTLSANPTLQARSFWALLGLGSALLAIGLAAAHYIDRKSTRLNSSHRP